MSIKDKVQRLIEFNQQCRIDELVNLVNHIFDKFEESLNDDMWDTERLNTIRQLRSRSVSIRLSHRG